MGTLWEDQRSLLQRFTSALWMSKEGGPGKDDGDSKGRGRKVPSGFEKILKRTRRGINHEDGKEEKKEASSSDKDAKKDDEEDK